MTHENTRNLSVEVFAEIRFEPEIIKKCVFQCEQYTFVYGLNAKITTRFGNFSQESFSCGDESDLG